MNFTSIVLINKSRVGRDMAPAMVEYGLLITGVAVVLASLVVIFSGDSAGLFNIDLGG